MHYSHSRHLAAGCPPSAQLRGTGERSALGSRGSGKPKRTEGQGQHRTEVHSDTAHSPLTLSLAFCSIPTAQHPDSVGSRWAKKLLCQQWHLVTLVPA